MTLVDDGRDAVQVYMEVLGDDGYGTRIRVPSSTPIDVHGLMQPVGSTEAAELGQAVGTLYRFLTAAMPGGAWARVRWDSRDWDVIGEPTRRSYTPLTTYDSVLLRARTPKAV